MTTQMTIRNKPLFGNLPQELYRYIYDLDNTYHDVFNTQKFIRELGHYLFKNQYTLIYNLIDELNYGVQHVQYAISVRTHHQYSNIICFNLIPVNPDADADCLYGFICEPKYAHLIPNIDDLYIHNLGNYNTKINKISPILRGLTLFYAEMVDDDTLIL